MAKVLRALLWMLLVCGGSCADAAKKTTSGPRHRLLLRVTQGTFAPELETRLEAELLLALRKQPELEVISTAVADSAARRRHVCVEGDFAACRDKVLAIEGALSVDLRPGAVPGTWVLAPIYTPSGGLPVWQSTLPFSPQPGEMLDEATARAARQLGGAVGPTGVRAGTKFEPAASSAGDLASLCDGLNDRSGIDTFEMRETVRSHLHLTKQDALVDDALAQLAKAGVASGDPCARLAALDAWRALALSRGWVPQKMPSEQWHASVDVVLRGSANRSPRSSDLVTSIAGALAARGFSLRNGGPPLEGEPCAGVDCVDGEDVSDITPTLGHLVLDVTETARGLKATARYFSRARTGKVALAGPVEFELTESGSSGGLDAAIWGLLEPQAPLAQAP